MLSRATPQPEASGFSTPRASRLPRRSRPRSSLASWQQDAPHVVVTTEDEETLIKSFRNLPKVLVTVPAELEVASIVWAKSLLISEAALPLVQGRAS